MVRRLRLRLACWLIRLGRWLGGDDLLGTDDRQPVRFHLTVGLTNAERYALLERLARARLGPHVPPPPMR